MTAPVVRSGRNWTQRISLALRELPAVVEFAGGWRAFAKRVWRLWRVHGYGPVVTWFIAAASFGLRNDAASYRAWLARVDAHRSADDQRDGRTRLVVYTTLGLAEAQLPAYGRSIVSRIPAIGEVVIVTDTAAADTLRAQCGDRLDEVTLAVRETLSLDSVLAELRARLAAFDEVVIARPGFVVGDVPWVDARGCVLTYGDEDVLDANGRSAPYFKPDFSIDLLLVEDYLSACLVMTRELAMALPTEHVDDFHSLALHVVERADRIDHVPRCFSHRVVDLAPRPARFLARFVERRYPGARVDPDTRAPRFAAKPPSVSVVIPTRDRLDLLKPCVEGIFESNADAPEIIILDNGSVEPATLAWLEEVAATDGRVRVLDAPGEFNWSALNNRGIDAATGDVLVFLNNDILPRSADWLAKLADVAVRPDVGVVGTLLVYPDETIQHAGVVVGFGGAADHIYCGTALDATDHQFVDPLKPRNVTAVTGACQAIARRTLEVIGHFDEEFTVVGSDVEFCIRAIDHDLVNVYLPAASLYHLESQTRSRRDPLEDTERTKAVVARYGDDPFYNANLSRVSIYPCHPI